MEDFDFEGDTVFDFVAGSNNTACIRINITDDVDYEGDHSFTVMLIDGWPSFTDPPGPVIGSNSATVVTIKDPEGAIL